MDKQLIGKGCFGKVMKVTYQQSQFAIKQIPIADRYDYSIALYETRILTKLGQHPNIVRLYHYFHRQSTFYIVMECLQSLTLANLITKVIDYSKLINYIVQITLSLIHLQNKNIIHRDLKPKNILVDKNGILKVADFGTYELIVGTSIDIAEIGCVACRGFIGTPVYAAPEIFLHQIYSYEVDVWSLGIIIYELTHCYLPFKGRNREELKSSILANKPYFKSTLNPNILALLQSILVIDPMKRITPKQIIKLPFIIEEMRKFKSDSK